MAHIVKQDFIEQIAMIKSTKNGLS